MENFERAIHNEVIAHGGTELARSMGVNRTRLLDCANPNREEHRMNIQMFGQILAHVPEDGRRRILNALLEEFGYCLTEKEAAKPQQLTQALLHMSKEIADVTQVVAIALEDGHISQTEKQLIKRELVGARESLDVLEQSVKVA